MKTTLSANKPHQQKTCLFSPIGPFDDHLLGEIALQVDTTFGLKTEIQSLTDTVSFAFDHKRNQYHSTPILEKFAELVEPRFEKVLILTSVDLFIPILTHVYGEAQLGGRTCIVSTARLHEGLEEEPDQEAFRKRVIKEALHELGHTFKLVHCKDPHCIMHYCRSIQDVDRKINEMCRYCKVLLEDATR